MASELKVDKFTGVTTAGSILVTGEGGSTATNLQQGLSKCWVRWNMSGTAANTDSLGVSSISDLGTGVCKQTLTNPFNNITFIIITGIGELTGGGNRGIGVYSSSSNEPTTTTTAFFSFAFPSDGGTSANDVDLNSAAWQGDLA